MKSSTLFFSAIALCSTLLAAGQAQFTFQNDFENIPYGSGAVIERNPQLAPWIFIGSKRKIDCTDGVFTLASAGGESRIFTKQLFKNGEITLKIRYNACSSKNHYYIGFVEFQPWHNRSAWLMFNSSTNGHLYMKNGANSLPKQDLHRVRTGALTIGQWYDLKLKLDANGAELWIDDVSKGKLTTPGTIPNANMRLIFAASGEGASISFDEINVKAVLNN